MHLLTKFKTLSKAKKILICVCCFVFVVFIGQLIQPDKEHPAQIAQPTQPAKVITQPAQPAQPVVKQKANPNARFEADVKQHLDENFFMTSWYPALLDVQLVGETVKLKVKNGTTKKQCEGLSVGVFSKVNANDSEYQGRFDVICTDERGQMVLKVNNPLK
jgi:hypothetical protein